MTCPIEHDPARSREVNAVAAAGGELILFTPVFDQHEQMERLTAVIMPCVQNASWPVGSSQDRQATAMSAISYFDLKKSGGRLAGTSGRPVVVSDLLLADTRNSLLTDTRPVITISDAGGGVRR
jgi:hypothetical protein